MHLCLDVINQPTHDVPYEHTPVWSLWLPPSFLFFFRSFLVNICDASAQGITILNKIDMVSAITVVKKMVKWLRRGQIRNLKSCIYFANCRSFIRTLFINKFAKQNQLWLFLLKLESWLCPTSLTIYVNKSSERSQSFKIVCTARLHFVFFFKIEYQ